MEPGKVTMTSVIAEIGKVQPQQASHLQTTHLLPLADVHVMQLLH